MNITPPGVLFSVTASQDKHGWQAGTAYQDEVQMEQTFSTEGL